MSAALWVPALLVVVAGSLWGIRHPRKRGEPFGRTRVIVIVIGTLATAVLVAKFVLTLIGRT